jgi:hypothetical protein
MADPSAKPTEMFCPFGCTAEQCWEGTLGYCEHLIGFSNDGKTFEPLSVDDRGYPIVLGDNVRKKEFFKEKVDKEKGHVLVNPEYQQKDFMGGSFHTAKKWVSARVYC